MYLVFMEDNCRMLFCQCLKYFKVRHIAKQLRKKSDEQTSPFIMLWGLIE